MALKINGIQLDELAADPGSPVEGELWYNTTDSQLRVFRGGVIRNVIYQATLDTHTGLANPHGTDLEDARTAGDTFGGDVNMGGFNLTNLASPINPADAATQQFVKDQVDQKLQGLDWQGSVLDKDLATPPVTPANGDRYIVAAVATGAWAGQEDSIAEWDGLAWIFSPPDNGFATVVEDEGPNGIAYLWNGSSWTSFGTAIDHGVLIGLGDDDHTQYLLVDGSRAMSGGLDMGTNNITNVGTVDGVDVSAHAARHIDGGADAIDGDMLEITHVPSNYTRTTVPAEVNQLDQLTSHLAGIDNKLGGVSLLEKAGRVLNASFAGNPKKFTVTFAAAFPDANYAVNLTAYTTGAGFAPVVESQVAGSFVINMGANNITGLIHCGWTATQDGESS